MEPIIQAHNRGTHVHVWGTGVQPIHHVGFIKPADGSLDDDLIFVYQSNSERWCASRWSRPPSDEVWGDRSTFLTMVMRDNLNFRGTNYEHRYNLRVAISTLTRICDIITHPRIDPTHTRKVIDAIFPELQKLADNELLTWGNTPTYAPFKEYTPNGYQGVLGTFDNVPRWSRPLLPMGTWSGQLHVHDKFSSGIHLLELGWK